MEEQRGTGKILITRLYDRLFSVLTDHNQILQIQAESGAEGRIGNIYVGKVKSISAGIEAAFVEIENGELTFLPLSEARDAVITNRQSDRADKTLRAGDELLVQFVKEPIKTKLAGVSTRLTLAGVYAVLEYRPRMRKSCKRLRISSKLPVKWKHMFDDAEILEGIPEQFCVIVRTNAAHAADRKEIAEEVRALSVQMERILSIGDKRTCFSCLHRSMPGYLTFIHNCYQSEYGEIVTDEKDIYEILSNDPKLSQDCGVRLYEDFMLPLYKLYSLETRIRELTDKKVWLRCGGYLVIEPTEALIAIDVNSGKNETGKRQEETFLKINLEAAKAIAIALRARNLSGMILVDFINMEKRENTGLLIQTMRELLKKDPVSAQVVDMTRLGLMEITRRKVNRSFAEQMAADKGGTQKDGYETDAAKKSKRR